MSGDRQGRILVTGGYGYDNAGDEAQLNASLSRLKADYPGYEIVVLTHDREQTARVHHHDTLADSPREAFYDHNSSRFYFPHKPLDKARFLLRASWVLANAYLLRLRLGTWLLDAKARDLLELLRGSDLLFYSGGGYITAKTRSRFWDALFFIACAKVFRVPVALSGQTIGLWREGPNRALARWSLNKVDLISVRDPVDSIAALEDIDMAAHKYRAVCDDATFCERSESAAYRQVLAGLGLHADDLAGGYIALNIHYWGMPPEQRRPMLEEIAALLDAVVAQRPMPVVLVPMTPTDTDTMLQAQPLFARRPVVFECGFDFRVIRALLADASVCVTMKHHPIIFALGEGTPTVALNYSSYYQHKNAGAMALFGVQDYCIRLDDAGYDRAAAARLIVSTVDARQDLSGSIRAHHADLRERQDAFFRDVRSVVRA